MQIKRFRAQRVTTADAQWLRDTLHREGTRLGTRVALQEDKTLTLRWGYDNKATHGVEGMPGGQPRERQPALQPRGESAEPSA